MIIKRMYLPINAILILLCLCCKAQVNQKELYTVEFVRDSVPNNNVLNPQIKIYIEGAFQKDSIAISQESNVFLNKTVTTDNLSGLATSIIVDRNQSPLVIVFKGKRTVIKDFAKYNYIRVRYWQNVFTIILSNKKPVFK